MRKLLLLSIGLTVLFFGISEQAAAQYLLAGQTVDVTYVDISPDKVLSAQRPGPSVVADSLDLDANGRADLRLEVTVSTSNFPSSSETHVMPLHDDIAIYSSSQSPYIIGFAVGDTIQQRGPQPAATLPANIWGSRSTIYSYSPPFLTHVANNPAGFQYYGHWLGRSDLYVAFRLRAGNGWRYGWLRIQVSSLENPATLVVKDYAFVSNTLAQISKDGIQSQLYPVPAQDWVTIQLPASACGTARVYDICGRLMLVADLSGINTRLNITELGAGIYTVQLNTSAGLIIRRLVKQ